MATANNAAAAKFTTDHRFTGQKQDGSGLTFMNARYYDPSIGTFISPDTIVPDAGNVFDYNRFMYVRGRVMNATDPSGHYAICFNEGSQPGEESEEPNNSTAINTICSELFNKGFLGSEYEVFGSSVEGKALALKYLAKMQAQYKSEEFTLIGYSWGGGAALEFARSLDSFSAKELGVHSKIDNLVTIDPVVGGRWWAGKVDYPAQVVWFKHPFNNVQHGLNLLAEEDAYFSITPWDMGVHLPVTDDGNIQNRSMRGTNHCTIGHASCPGGFASSGFGHYPDGSGDVNNDTLQTIVDFLDN